MTEVAGSGRSVAALRAAGCVYAEEEARLLAEAAGSPGELDQLVARRVAGTPLEHLLGWVEFCGLRIAVAEGVFVPRRRTEHLVTIAVTIAVALTRRAAPSDAVVVELCCGSAAISVALRAALPTAEIHAADIDPVAVACARRNLDAGSVHQGDLYAPLPAGLRGRVDVLVANAPYVPTGAIALMPPEAREHEPARALDGGPDGLDVQRRITAEAATWLAPRGRLLIETSQAQAAGTAAAMAGAGLSTRTSRDPDLDATVVIGTAPARQSG